MNNTENFQDRFCYPSGQRSPQCSDIRNIHVQLLLRLKSYRCMGAFHRTRSAVTTTKTVTVYGHAFWEVKYTAEICFGFSG